MRKSISPRELLLLGFLIIITVYYFVIQGPIKKQTEELEAQKSEIETNIAVTAPTVEKKKMMQEEIDKVFAQDPNPVSISNYDNIENIILEMNAIFDTGDNSYQINYATGGEVKYEDNIVERWIKISFTAPNYDDALSRIGALHDSVHKYQITNLYVSGSKDDTCSVSIVLVDYEYASDYSE